MALEVKYAEIRSNVISKLSELSGDMITNLGNLDGIVGEIPGCAEGDVINQSDRIVLNLEYVLEDNIGAIKEYLLERTGDARDLKRLNEMIVILPDGSIETWFLR